jgi:hypothetical protein
MREITLSIRSNCCVELKSEAGTSEAPVWNAEKIRLELERVARQAPYIAPNCTMACRHAAGRY